MNKLISSEVKKLEYFSSKLMAVFQKILSEIIVA